METTKRSIKDWVYGVLGIAMLVSGVTDFLGWPHPFDPEAWTSSLVLVVMGLGLLWMFVFPRAGWLQQTIGVALLVAAMVVRFARVPWPF